jgi:hypothetical protein
MREFKHIETLLKSPKRQKPTILPQAPPESESSRLFPKERSPNVTQNGPQKNGPQKLNTLQRNGLQNVRNDPQISTW